MSDQTRVTPAHPEPVGSEAEAEPQRPALTDFTPVPRQRNRRDGWTPQRQRAFIANLAECGRVRAAAEALGMTPEGAYHLRRQPGAEPFAAAWRAALAAAADATP